MAISLGLGIVAALAGAPDAGLGIAASSPTFGALNQLHYMQTEESAADVAGVKAMEKAGMSGKGLVDFFYKFRNVETFSHAERYEFFRTHPLSRERIQALTDFAKKQPHWNTPDDPAVVAQFAIVKAKLAGFLDDPLKTFQLYPESDHSFGRALLRCVGVGKYRRVDAGGTMCPSFMVTREEKHSTRGRAHLLQDMLKGDLLQDGELARFTDPHL